MYGFVGPTKARGSHVHADVIFKQERMDRNWAYKDRFGSKTLRNAKVTVSAAFNPQSMTRIHNGMPMQFVLYPAAFM